MTSQPPDEPRSAEAGDPPVETALRREAAALGTPEDWHASLTRHARTFRFAGRWLPARSKDLIAGLYTWCRFTDDLVDESDLPVPRQTRRLEAWSALSRRAYQEGDTGIALLDTVLGESARRGIPYTYADELIEGVRMDLEPRHYGDDDELALYTRRVAGVVGAWMTEIFGVREPAVLDEALRMGHAMQLTNILRDVGEDWERGRLYLPATRLAAHGLQEGRPPDWVPEPGAPRPAYRDLLQELAAETRASYDRAFRAIPSLPFSFRVSMAVAARAYEGILSALEANQWDNVHRRAYTSRARKLALGSGATLHVLTLSLRRPGIDRS